MPTACSISRNGWFSSLPVLLSDDVGPVHVCTCAIHTESAPVTPPSTMQAQRAELHVYFAEHLRGSLFSGFLTLGGFLLSLQMFIVVKIKEDLYDSRCIL